MPALAPSLCETVARHPIRCVVALALATAGSAQAQTTAALNSRAVEEVVVTASGFEQKIVDAPASISVVSAEELAKRPYITLIDAVRELEGVDIGETSDKTGQRTISIRGMGSDYTLILIDGKRQNNHGDIYPNSFGGNQFNHIPPLDAIERIEVIRGPASTLYGADALGGVINIITKKVSDTWRASTTIGHSIQENDMFGADTTYDLTASGPLIRNVLGLSLRASRYERDASLPEYEVITDPSGETHERVLGFGAGGKTVNNVNESYGATLNWRISDRQDMSFDFDTSEQVYDNTPFTNNLGTTAYPLGTVDNVGELWRAQPRAGYSADQTFTRDQWAVTHRGDWGFASSFVSLAHIETANNGRTLPLTATERALQTQIFEGTGAYAGLSPAQRRAIMEETFLPRPKRTMESTQYTLDAKLDFQIEGFAGRHHLVVGTQYIDGELEDGVFGMEGGTDGAGTVQQHKMYSLFAENNWTPVDPLTVTLGVRYDDHKVFGDHVSPRVYAVYTINPSWSIKGGVATGFKTPKTTDLYDGVTGFGGQGVTPFVGNPDLKPETSVNTEIALYWTGEGGDHNFNVTYFRNDFKDKIARGETNQSCEATGGVRPCANLGAYADLGYATYAQNINIDEAKIRGAEVAGRYRIIGPLSARANYTYIDSEQTSGPLAGQPLTNTAKHMANGTLDWAITDAFSTQLTWEMRSKRYRGVGANNEHLYYKDYDVLHLGAQYRFNDHVAFNARINNLLDEDFTSFQTSFTRNGDTGPWTPTYVDDFNNKDKARNYWLSVNLAF
ncbi:TonB-dependent receptor domain-containing protein [Steroidobacter cummioxidans]|uniref:TonB-dependent receptor domain-containing protein n=1 Tax=Steroidobacter cummioxidans TaxID=1803913 RepID=UPI000E31B942|nr:TonB-dependent receptor [Steroidobacter cummioxidans]